MKNYLLKSVKAGIAREGALKGGGPNARRPNSWTMLKQGCYVAKEWGEGGRVLWSSLEWHIFFLCRASQLYAYSMGKTHQGNLD